MLRATVARQLTDAFKLEQTFNSGQIHDCICPYSDQARIIYRISDKSTTVTLESKLCVTSVQGKDPAFVKIAGVDLISKPNLQVISDPPSRTVRLTTSLLHGKSPNLAPMLCNRSDAPTRYCGQSFRIASTQLWAEYQSAADACCVLGRTAVRIFHRRHFNSRRISIMPLSENMQGANEDSGAAIDMAKLFSLSPIPSTLLTPTLRIVRASASFFEYLNLTSKAYNGLDLFDFLERENLVDSRESCNCIKEDIEQAIATRLPCSSRTVNTSQHTALSARIIPIFKQNTLLNIILEWQQVPVKPEIPELRKDGLFADDAFRILVQTVKDYAIFLLDTNGNVATWNTGAELLKRYKREDIVGKHFSTFYGAEDLKAKKPQKELEICMREGRVEDEGWRYRKDGTRFWANVIITAIFKDGVHVGFSKVTRDLTERKMAEWRLIAAHEESEKLKSVFLANMSHEIRTPMHGMLCACALLLDTPLTEEQRDLANIISDSGQVLLQIINDILDYSKLASGNFSINSDTVSVTGVITSVARSEQTTLQSGVNLELHLDSNLPEYAQGDPLRYRQIIQNLLGNAAKFTETGSIRVKASLLEEDDSDFTILTEVIDTGIGISKDAAEKLFTPFVQFDDTTKKRYKGTGLGLSIAKSLVELMGGKIGFRANPESHGSIFWFTAKLRKPPNLSKHATNGQPTVIKEFRPSSPDLYLTLVDKLKEIGPRKRLLIAEDNIINMKVMLRMLRSFGFRNVDTASDGDQATTMVQRFPKGYDLVLMDISMPFVDGYDATARIRKSGINVPIVAMTAHALKGDKELCLENGIDDYVPKPVDRKLLARVLLKWSEGPT